MPLSRYLNPKNDIAFKKVFGAEKNKDILIHFLNDVLNKTAKDLIKEVTFLDTVQQPEIAIKKQSIIDVLCTDQSGVQYIVEMQVDPVRGFEKRAQYYAAKAYCNQMKKKEKYYGLKEVVFLAIADYVVFPDKEHYKSDHIILDKKSHEHDLKDFSFTFIELPKFKKNKISELETYEERWCYFFKHAHEPDNIEELIATSSEVIKKAYDELYSYNWTEDELLAYEEVEKANLDAEAREDYVLEKGKQEGIQLGKQEGIQLGKQEGIQLGKQEGIQLEKKHIAINMLAENQFTSLIARVTGISEAVIIKLRDERNGSKDSN
jgi:predicted transposase/invertase (TIGR01784 family)